MGLRTVMVALRSLLNDNGFDRQVEEYGYYELSQAQTNTFLVIEFAGTGAAPEGPDARNNYGGGRTRVWKVRISVHSRVEGFRPTESAIRLGESVDTIMNLIDKYSSLGTDNDEIDANLIAISPIVEVQMNESEETQWLAVMMMYDIDECVVIVEAE